jgi:divalent metal cation (Fe/Co/Zn/Cd) transporter
MESLSAPQAASRQRTLLAALLLSAWAPLATGIAVLTSRSTTQLADFVRRTVELMALFISWWVFRQLATRRPGVGAGAAAGPGLLDTGCPGPELWARRLEKTARLSVAIALGSSGAIMLVLGLSRLRAFQPGGNVYPGLAIALLGLITNSWFWRRYTAQNKEHYTPVIDAQRQLYGAKSLADLCVLTALATVAISPAHPVTRYVDALGSIALALYLVWSGLRAARTPVVGVGSLGGVPTSQS